MTHLLLLGSLWLYCTIVVQTVRFRPSERQEPQDISLLRASVPLSLWSTVAWQESFRAWVSGEFTNTLAFIVYDCDIGRIIIIRTLWLEYMIWHSTITNCVSEFPAKLCFTFDNRPDQITIKIGILTATGARFSKGHRPCHENG